jgi:SAM-dependent methyltransferase
VTGAFDPPPPGRPFRASTIAHVGRTILGPTSAADLEALLDAAATAGALHHGSRVLDIGCGKGDLLIRAASRGATGTGIDRNPAFLAEARHLAAVAGVGDRLRLEVADAAGFETDGDADLVACVGATDALGGPIEAPARLASLARHGGAVLIGEGYWRRVQSAAEAATFGMEADELVDLEATLDRMRAGGLDVLVSCVASLADWDAYEDDYASALERWVVDHPDDPAREDLAGQAAAFRGTWTAWRREAMGFVTVLLRRR